MSEAIGSHRNKELDAIRLAAYKAELKAAAEALAKIKKAEYRKNNIAMLSKAEALWREKNLDRARSVRAKYRAENAQKVAERKRRYHEAHPHRANAVNSRRRAMRVSSMPGWANEFFIKEMFDLACRRTAATGIKWHVDHIVPLQSKLVCGLHCEANMRVITAFDNISKSNRFWPDMP